jgi:hypothetical protein
MDRQNILVKRAIKTKPISIRISYEHFKWMKENNYSPTGILLEASKDLGFKENDRS